MPNEAIIQPTIPGAIDKTSGTPSGFPDFAFEHDNPETDATPVLTLKSPWTFEVEDTSRFRATTATAQAMANGAATKVVFGTEIYDNLGEYAIATGVFTATQTGYYQVNASVLSASVAWDALEGWRIGLYRSGVLYNYGFINYADADFTNNMGSTYSDQIYLTVGQTLDIRVLHNQGGNVNTLNAAAYNYFSVHRLS